MQSEKFQSLPTWEKEAWYSAVDSWEIKKIEHVIKYYGLKPKTMRGENYGPLHQVVLKCANLNTPRQYLVLEYLLNAGFDLFDLAPSGKNALHLLCETLGEGVEKTLLLLTSRGLKIAAADDARYTPLHQASYYGNARAVKALLEMGASTDLLNNEGLTPLEVNLLRLHEGLNYHLLPRLIENLSASVLEHLKHHPQHEMLTHSAKRVLPGKNLRECLYGLGKLELLMA